MGEVLDYSNGKAKIKLTESLNLNDGIRIISNEDIGFNVTSILKNNKPVKEAYKNDIIYIPVKTVKKHSKVVKTTDINQINEIREKIKIDKKISIVGKCTIRIGMPIILEVSDFTNKVKVESNYIVQKAINSNTTVDKIKTQLNKLGNTIYIFNELNIESDNNIFIPIDRLNELRRKALSKLDEKRLYKKEFVKKEYNIVVPNYERKNLKSILIHNLEDYKKYKDSFDIIYIDNESDYSKINDDKCVLKLPRVIEHLKKYKCKLLVGELGSVNYYNNINTDFSLNVLNSYSVAFLHSIGVDMITLSHELNYNQNKDLIKIYKKRYGASPNLEVIVSGNVEAMICKYNMLNKYNVNKGYLIDRFNNKYKIVYKDNLMHIYDYKKLNLKDDYYKIGINSVRINKEI